MANVNTRQPDNPIQLQFDFTFDDVQKHVDTVVIPRITEIEKRLSSVSADIPVERAGTEPAPLNEQAATESYGSWLSFDRRISSNDRLRYNDLALDILQKAPEDITEQDRKVLRYYSGYGGTGREGERGVLYDYYTSPPVASMMWTLLNRIKPITKGARILEPSCGTGVFFLTAPRDVILAGVEIDPRTAAVARLLHPAAHIRNMSFEAFNVSRNTAENFDFVIGNAPFGDRGDDTAFIDMPDEKSLDRYFISRSIDALQPGGVMAVIVHPGILDGKSHTDFRASVVRKAVFLGAIHLNDHSFSHTHTQIQPDILFFQKHPEGMEHYIAQIPQNLLQEELHTAFINPVFPYYDIFPQHVMGVISQGTGQWGNDEVKGKITPESINEVISAFNPASTIDLLMQEKVYDNIRRKYPVPKAARSEDHPETRKKLTREEADLVTLKHLRPGFLKTEQDSVYILSDSFFWFRPPQSQQTNLTGRIDKILGISGGVREIRDAMRQSLDVELMQARILQSTEDYKTAYNVYPKNDPVILSFLLKNPAVSGIYDALIDPSSPIVKDDNLYNAAARVDGHSPAVRALYTLSENLQTATISTINKWFPDESEALIREMNSHPDIFLTPRNTYELREDFLSGNAWEKIDELEKAKALSSAAGDKKTAERYTRYQDELRKAALWTPLEEAVIAPQASWMPEEIINAFVHDDSCPRSYAMQDITLGKNNKGKWGEIIGKEKIWDERADPIVYYLNYQKQRSQHIDTESFNKEYDELFLNYVANHTKYRSIVETTYNRLYNAEIKTPVKTYPIYIDGWTGSKTPKPHQWESVHHLYRQQKGISALGTGFGKTLSAIMLYSVLRQEGKLHRAFFQVPNNKIKDWSNEITDVMPSLKIGYIDPEMPGYSSQNKRYAAYHRLANGKYDILIFPESAAGEIQLSPENDKNITNNVVARYLVEKNPGTARKTEELKDSIKHSLQNGRTNKTISFEDLGCDAIFVDEAHHYKNLFTSNLSRELGLNDGRRSDKAMSLFKKTSLIRQQNDNKNVFLFTATPLTNSPLEYYNMIMYYAPEELERFNILTINNFIRNFADIKNTEVYDWKSGNVTTKKTLVGFYNVRTLQDIFFKYVDYQNDPKAINLEKPDPVHTPHIIPKDSVQAETVKDISNELETFSKLDIDKREELYPHQNYLTFYTKLRTASLDLELYDPQAFPGWHNPKLDALAKQTWNIFENTGAGQLICCDRVFSGDSSFNIHDKIASYLVTQGFLENQIAVINGFTKSGGALSDEKVQRQTSQTVADFNAGKYKVIIGTTACIGEGLNLQENSSAIHHFDIPFRPSDFIQRNGRVDRQGNSQGKVHINSYMSRGTIDNYSVNLVQNKANWIDDLLKTKTNVFVNKDDESSIDPAELLLSLSEEWGDAEKSKALREKIKNDAEEALRKGKETKIKSLITSLSKLRGPIYNYRGDKTSFSYMQIIDRINNIEKALSINPDFRHNEILGGKKPFLYSAKYDSVIMEGDYYNYCNRHCIINSLDLKKLTIHTRPIDNKHEYNYSISLSEFNPSEYTFIHSPDKNFFYAVKLLDKIGFYSINDQKTKELFYTDHLRDYAGNSPLPFLYSEDGKANNIIIGNSSSFDYEEQINVLNPFSPSSIEAVQKADTITFYPEDPVPSNTSILSAMKTLIPDVFTAVSEKLPDTPPLYGKIAALRVYTPQNVQSVVRKLCEYPYYHNDPLKAAKTILKHTPDERKAELRAALKKSGCTDVPSMKNIISMWSSNNDSSPDTQKFMDDHFHVVGIDV